jgi:hypothetical protein
MEREEEEHIYRNLMEARTHNVVVLSSKVDSPFSNILNLSSVYPSFNSPQDAQTTATKVASRVNFEISKIKSPTSLSFYVSSTVLSSRRRQHFC